MDIWVNDFREIQNNENSVAYSWNKSLNYLHFPQNSPWRKFGELFIQQQPDLNFSSNAYHNHIHSAEVIFSSAILIKEEFKESEYTHYAPYLLFAMMCHDINHNGSHNQFPYELENLAIQSVKKALNQEIFINYWNHYLQNEFGSFTRFQKRIERIILGTDFKFGIEKNIVSYQKNIKNNPFVRLNTLANEADILVSIIHSFGQEKGSLLSIEQNNPQVATKEGQLFFLKHLARYVSNASKSLQINNYILKQIEALS